MRLPIFIIILLSFFIVCLPAANSKALHSAYGLDDTVRELIPSVVLIVGLNDEVTLGTGFIVAEEGLVLTNYHVVEGADEIYAVWDSTVNRDFEQCTLSYFDEELDLALLRLPGTGYLPIPIASVEDAEIADDIICLGFPIIDSDDFLADTFNIAVTRGIISSIQRDNEGEIIEIWTDAAITYGNSGGPLYDIDLEGVIGINNLFASRVKGNYNLAIPYSLFMHSVTEWAPSWRDSCYSPYGGIAEEALGAAKDLYAAGDVSLAIEALEVAMDAFPREETETVKLLLAEWYIEVERFKDAFDIYENLGDALPSDDEFLIDFGILAYKAGENERAIELLLPFIPDRNDMVYLTLAMSYLDLGQFTEANTYAELALDVTESEEVKDDARDVIEQILHSS